MIRITDRTLSCIDGKELNPEEVTVFLNLLIKAKVDSIELSKRVYKAVSPLPDFPSYVLRVEFSELAALSELRAKYPEVSRFVCANAPPVSDKSVCAEIFLNDIREAYTVARYSDYANIRIQGLDDVLLGDYRATFARLKEAFHGNIQFCPSNRYYCAAALAAEWVVCGFGNDIVTSFCGIGGFASTEEVIMMLRTQRLRKVGSSYEFFPEMARLFEKITGEPVAPNKPILGKKIFHVESGIHVDGILKLPKCYEPFPPETVGLKRRIVLGKHSGAASIRAKAKRLNLGINEAQIPFLLKAVKSLSEEKSGEVTDAEFSQIARRVVL